MKLLLTSSGITNDSIRGALTDLLGKPINEASALCVMTGMYPFAGGGNYVLQGLSKMQLGWKSLGILEPSVLPSIEKAVWVRALQEAEVLFVWGGDPLFLAYWFKASGMTEVLPSLLEDLVYVGVSAGAMAAGVIIGEAYTDPPKANHETLTSEEIMLGDITRTLKTAHGAGLVNFAIIPHYGNPNHPDAAVGNAEIWAGKILAQVYAIDEQTAIKVNGDSIEVISEGNWKLFNPA